MVGNSNIMEEETRGRSLLSSFKSKVYREYAYEPCLMLLSLILCEHPQFLYLNNAVVGWTSKYAKG